MILGIDLNKISGDRLVTYLFTILAIVLPGFGYLYLSNIELFLGLSTIKLIILSIFHSTPLFIISMTMVLYIYDELEIHKSKEDVFDVLVFTSYISLIAYFIAIGVFYGIFYSNKALQVGLLEHIYRTYFIYFFVLVLYKKVLPLLRRKKKKR